MREVEVGDFAIDRGPVTVAQFARFVHQTGYLTVAERPPDPATTPTPIPRSWSQGSAVFQPDARAGPVERPGPLVGYCPRRQLAPSLGAEQRQLKRRITRSRTSPTKTPRPSRSGRARRSRPRRSGSTRREAASIGAIFAWGDEQHPGGELMANSWQGDFPWRNTGARGWRGRLAGRAVPRQRLRALRHDRERLGMDKRLLLAPRRGLAEDREPLLHAATKPARRDPGRRVTTSAARRAHPPPRDQGRLAPLRTDLLPALPARRTPTQAIDTSTSHIGFRCVPR